MDNTEKSLKILGKFLATADYAKICKYYYDNVDIPKKHSEAIMTDLIHILDEYNKIEIKDFKKDPANLWCSSEDEEYFNDGIEYFDVEDTSNDVGC